MLAMYRLLDQWLEISELQCTLESFSFKYRLCAHQIKPTVPVDRTALDRVCEILYFYGGTKVEARECAHEIVVRPHLKRSSLSTWNLQYRGARYKRLPL